MNCLGCGLDLPKRPGKGRRKRWCSIKCRAKAKYRPTEKAEQTCEGCGRQFIDRKKRFCSAKCRQELRKHDRQCAVCGSQFKGHGECCCGTCGQVWRHAKACGSVEELRNRQKRRRSGTNHSRRARKFGVRYQHINRLKVFERDGWVCGICGESVDPNERWPSRGCASLDHILPLSQGGDSTYDNVQCAHYSCNHRKGAAVGGSQILAG